MSNYRPRDEVGQNILDSIGVIIRDLREEAGLTQRQAAKLANSTQNQLSDLENGKADIFVLTLQRWARAFGCNLEMHFVPIEDEFNEALAEALAEIEEEEV